MRIIRSILDKLIMPIDDALGESSVNAGEDKTFKELPMRVRWRINLWNYGQLRDYWLVRYGPRTRKIRRLEKKLFEDENN